MTNQESHIYYHAHLEALEKCRGHLLNSLKLIDFEILSCKREIQHQQEREPTKLTKPIERTSEDRIAFVEAANYQPKY